MTEKDTGNGLKGVWKRFWQKDKRLKLFLIGFIGLVLFLAGAWELLVFFDTEPISDYEPPYLTKIEEWGWMVLGIGAIMMIGGFLYYHEYNKNFKRFKELIETDSKAQFVRNIDEIEKLAIDLGPDFEGQVIEKRELFRVKTR